LLLLLTLLAISSHTPGCASAACSVYFLLLVIKSVGGSLFREQNILSLAQKLKANFSSAFWTRGTKRGRGLPSAASAQAPGGSAAGGSGAAAAAAAHDTEKTVFVPHPFQLPHIIKLMYKRTALNTLAQFVCSEEGQALFDRTNKVRLSKFQRRYEDFCVRNMSMFCPVRC
jgi:hypothetical protein